MTTTPLGSSRNSAPFAAFDGQLSKTGAKPEWPCLCTTSDVRPLVIIGNPNTVFIRRMAAHWHRRGINVAIVTANQWKGRSHNEDGVPVYAAEGAIEPQSRALLDLLLPVMDSLERELHAAQPERVAAALRSWGNGAPPPSLLAPLIEGLAIAETVNRLDPAAVFGNEAFAYGVATALCRNTRRTMFVWGGDVMQFCETSETALRMMRSTLSSMHYVLAASEAVRTRVVSRLGVPDSRALLLSLGVDRSRFARASADRRAATLHAFGIPPGRQVVLNSRRLRAHWGGTVAVEAGLLMLAQCPNAHMVCLGGDATGIEVAEARARACASGLADRFTAIDGHLDEQGVADLMSAADVFLSLTQDDEPLSVSVLQGAAAGGAPVIGDQQTYREACAGGLRAALVPADSPEAIAGAVAALLRSPSRRADMAAGNHDYIARHHDIEPHMARLLSIILGTEQMAALRREPRVPAAPGCIGVH